MDSPVSFALPRLITDGVAGIATNIACTYLHITSFQLNPPTKAMLALQHRLALPTQTPSPPASPTWTRPRNSASERESALNCLRVRDARACAVRACLRNRRPSTARPLSGLELAPRFVSHSSDLGKMSAGVGRTALCSLEEEEEGGGRFSRSLGDTLLSGGDGQGHPLCFEVKYG